MKKARAKDKFEKIWEAHIVGSARRNLPFLISTGKKTLVHEATSPQAFGRSAQPPNGPCAVPMPPFRLDHNVHTVNGRKIARRRRPGSELCITLWAECPGFRVTYLTCTTLARAILHIIGPEQGITTARNDLVVRRLAYSTHGAMGALAFGIGTRN